MPRCKQRSDQPGPADLSVGTLVNAQEVFNTRCKVNKHRCLRQSRVCTVLSRRKAFPPLEFLLRRRIASLVDIMDSDLPRGYIIPHFPELETLQIVHL
jgi:hypothetical protein